MEGLADIRLSREPEFIPQPNTLTPGIVTNVVFIRSCQIMLIVILRLSGKITGHFTDLKSGKQQYFHRHGQRLPLTPELAYRSSNSKFRCAVLQDKIVAKTKIASANNISINCNGKRSKVFKNSNPGR